MISKINIESIDINDEKELLLRYVNEVPGTRQDPISKIHFFAQLPGLFPEEVSIQRFTISSKKRKMDFQMNEFLLKETSSDENERNFLLSFELDGHVASTAISSQPFALPPTQIHLTLNSTKDRLLIENNINCISGNLHWGLRLSFPVNSPTRLEGKFFFPQQPVQSLVEVVAPHATHLASSGEWDGIFSGGMEFSIPLDQPEELTLHPWWKGEVSPRCWPSALREPFERVSIQGDDIGLNSLPKQLVQSVLLAEDPNFFAHPGIDTAIILPAILENWEAGKFVRGGSSLTMQLVKNLALKNQKTLVRKAEELIWMWAMNSDSVFSKEKQLEVYFNQIEWGPNVYGIAEASQFYFRKSPSQLNLDESIFLASIIPNPRMYTKMFNSKGEPTEFYAELSESLRFQMYMNDWIEEEELNGTRIFTD